MLQRTSANVTADVLPTVQINGVVWTQALVGNLVYAGGSFTKARPAGAPEGTDEVDRYNLLAYDITTGELVPNFAPRLNGAVKALKVSPDHKTLYVGGEFTRVGTAKRSFFAAFSLSPYGLRKLAPSPNRTVNALAATTTTVYLGGSFSAVSGKTRSRLAAISASSGKLTSWNPVANGTVQAMTLTTDGAKVIAGGAFSTLGTKTALGMGSVSAQTGSVLTWKITSVVKDYGPHAAILSLHANKTTVFGTGYTYGAGNFEGAFAASAKDGSITWLQDCHGDTYDVAPIGNIVYSVGHAHYCKNIGGFPDTSPRIVERRALAVTRSATGTVAKNGQLTYWGGTRKYGNFEGQPAPSMYDWFPTITPGTYTGMGQGAWSVTGGSTYLSLAGEFLSINGKAQQGLARMAIPTVAPNAQGPVDRRTFTTPTPVVQPDGTVAISWPANWDRDDLTLRYQLTRDDLGFENRGQTTIDTVSAVSTEWKRPTLRFVDRPTPGKRAVVYSVTATDPSGNSVTTARVKVTLP